MQLVTNSFYDFNICAGFYQGMECSVKIWFENHFHYLTILTLSLSNMCRERPIGISIGCHPRIMSAAFSAFRSLLPFEK